MRPVRVRFDEAGADGQVRAGSLLRYLQDLAWQHSEAAGFDRDWYAARGMGWLVRGVELELVGGAGYGDTLAVTTRVTGWRRMWARRESEVARSDGTGVARARIDWVLLDARGRPIRIPPAIEVFAPQARAFAPLTCDLPPTPIDADHLDLAVRAADVDPMGHLNNASYADLVDEAVADVRAGPIRAPATMRIEYLRPAMPGMTLRLCFWPDADGLAVRLVDAEASTELARIRLR